MTRRTVRPENEYPFEVRLCSGPPWNLVLKTEQVGPDILCSLHGGAEHIGAAAVAHWNGRRAYCSGNLVVERHKEGPLATEVAHQVCQATHTTVACLAGIHYDGISSSEIRAIESEARRLASKVARQLADQRIRRETP